MSHDEEEEFNTRLGNLEIQMLEIKSRTYHAYAKLARLPYVRPDPKAIEEKRVKRVSNCETVTPEKSAEKMSGPPESGFSNVVEESLQPPAFKAEANECKDNN